MEEKRRFIRFKLLLKGEIEAETGSCGVEILDCSRKGLKIYAPQSHFLQADPLKLKVYLPARDLPVGVQAKVRWMQPQDKGCVIGAEVDWMELDAKNEILDFAYDKWKETIRQDYASAKFS